MLLRKMSTTTSSSRYYDIIITGGGMVGSVLACKLAQSLKSWNPSILMIDNGPQKNWDSILNRKPEQFSNRVSAINNATKDLFQSINIWDSIISSRCKNVSEMKIWGNGSKNISTVFNDPNFDHLAYIVENEVLISAAMKSISNYENVDVLHGSQVTDFNLPKNDENIVFIKLKNGLSLECNLLVGTDGANSSVRQAMGVQYISWKYKQQAIVATLKLSEMEKNDTAWQKFVSSGPVALLPLSDSFSSLVWTTTPEQANHLLSLSNESFVDSLNSVLWEDPIADTFSENVTQAISYALKTLNIDEKRKEIIPPTVIDVLENSRATFPLGLGHAVCYVTPRVALVGDAAHRVHPLAGQGVNLGFGDVQRLSDALYNYTSNGSKLGDFEALKEYESVSLRYNIPKIIGIDLIQKVAGHQWSPLLTATNVGLQITNAISPLKKILIKSAGV